MRRFAIAFALLAVMAIPAAAQRGHGVAKWLDQKTLAAAQELGGTLVTWARAEILPQAQAWKNQLDASLSPADLSALNELRREAAALRDRHMTLKASMRKAWKSEDYDALKTTREQLKGLGAERKEIFEQLKPIAERSRATLESIGESARPQVKGWIDEARIKVEGWWQQNKEGLNPMVGEAIKRLMLRRHDLQALIEPKLRTKAAVAKFMLWNGEDFTRQIEGMLQNGELEGLQDLNLE